MKLLKEWVIPTLIVLLLAGVVIAVAIPLVNASSDEDTFEERRGERDSFNGDREDERGSFERDGGRGERDGFSLLGLMGGIVKQVVFMLVGGGITLGMLALIRQFTHNNKPPQPETA